MNTTQSARSYDLFKLVVALILLAIIIILLLQQPAPTIVAGQAATSTPTEGIVASAPTHTSAPSLPAPTNTNPPPPTATLPPTLPPATATPRPTETPAAAAPTATLPPVTPTVAPTQAPTEAPTPGPTQVPTPAAANPNANCPLALTSRLAVGMKARVLSNLNLRSSPDITNNLIRTSPAGTTLEVTGGPQCVPFQNGAYLWWEVRTPDGQTGWSAEGSLAGSYYFLEPVK